MTERILPGIGLTGYWDQGAPWKVGGDQNWLRSSVLTQLAVESATTSLPASPLNGVIYIVPAGDVNENQVAARDNGAWVYMPPQKGWVAYVRDAGALMNFDGASWAPVAQSLAGSDGASKVGTSDGGTVQAALDAIPSEVDPAGTAVAKVAEHNADAAAHPALSAFITAEADRAETAADASLSAAGIFVDVAAFDAVAVDGKVGGVEAVDPKKLYDQVHKVGGISSLTGKSAPSSAALTELQGATALRFVSVPGYGVVITDGVSVCVGVTNAGVLEAGTLAVNTLSAQNAAFAALPFGVSTIKAENYPGFGVILAADEDGRAAVGVKKNGSLTAGNLDVSTINGKAVGGSIDRNGGVYPYQINYHNNSGESLAEGSTGTALTTVAEYDNIGFPARASSPGAFVPLDVASTQYAARGESPMYGALGFMKKLIADENGLEWQQNDFQQLGCNNGYSGQKLAFMVKGTAPYTAVMSQAASGKAIANALGKSFGVLATDLTIGANDGNPADLTPTATFKAQILQYASDLNVDFKVQTGQLRDAILTLGQLASRAPQLAVAQLETSNESNLIFLAAPMYPLTYYDTLHINPESEKWLGGFYSLVKKRVIVDRLPWEPLQPVSYLRVGNDVYLTFNKGRLVFDTALVSAQVNHGFDCVDSGGTPIALSGAPQITGDNVLRFSFASALPTGARIRAGHVPSVGRTDAFVGGSCNLRDSTGDWLKYTFDVAGSPVAHPMHNWCAIFSQPIY